MRSAKTKILLLLIVYFAGFATSIYTLAPDGRTEENYQNEPTENRSAVKDAGSAETLKTYLTAAKQKAIQAKEYFAENILHR